ncbi:cell division protein FtsQ/DivIB [Bacillus marasmi]|uniref:cell division protein FtsQ/DivIB n=1 Tax=Bacillus marasmi TaxID=1926279 RepID=UPI0011CBC481|nr:FtsQ-type POTRA domain-containing protein [Bacillus marasmi]
MDKGKIVSLEDRIPKLKEQRRRKANKRLTILLFFFFLLMSCIIYFQSPLSHVRNIYVKGNEVYSSEDIEELSGLTKKTNIWKVNEKLVEDNLRKLPEIKAVSVQVQLPSSVTIKLEEHKQIAYINKGDHYSPVLENGEILPAMQRGAFPVQAPILVGFSKGKVLNKMIDGLENLPSGIVNSISEIQYSPKETDEYSVKLFMNDGYEVHATLRSFQKKMAHYPSIISQLNPEEKGIIDLEVGSYFKAFKQEGTEEVEDAGEAEG